MKTFVEIQMCFGIDTIDARRLLVLHAYLVRSMPTPAGRAVLKSSTWSTEGTTNEDVVRKRLNTLQAEISAQQEKKGWL